MVASVMLSTPPLTAMTRGPWLARIRVSRSASMTPLRGTGRGRGARLGPGLHGPADRKASPRHIVTFGLHRHLPAGARHVLGAYAHLRVGSGCPRQDNPRLEAPTQADRRGFGEAGCGHFVARLGVHQQADVAEQAALLAEARADGEIE